MMTCKICNHPERKAIDKAIIDQRSLRDIAGQYGISRSAVDRHKQYIPRALAVAKQAETIAETTTLLSRIERQTARCESLRAKAEADGKWAGAAAAARVIHGYLELRGKLNGELQPGGTRVAINFGDITKIDVRALSQEQLNALYSRLLQDREHEARSLSDAEIEARLAELALTFLPDAITIRETILFDDVTVPPGPGYEMNVCWDPKKAWRDAAPKDRYRMLQAAWKRETGENLAVNLEDLGPRPLMEIEFDLADERGWMAWPLVRLKHVKVTPENAAAPKVIEGGQ